jgi:hypothetical protein
MTDATANSQLDQIKAGYAFDGPASTSARR